MSDYSEIEKTNAVRVLVADDDPTARQLIASRLHSLACECEEAEDGIAAWHAIMSNSFNLAIVDLSMPNLDGFELIRCARNHPRTKHMPIVVVTARNDKQAIEEALLAGATSFLTKPINWTTFSAHVDYLLKLSRSEYEARKKIRHFEAANRVKDAVLGNVLTGAADHARSMLDVTEDLLHTSTAAETSRRTADALKKMAHVAQSLQAIVEKASRVATTIPETVTVEDEHVSAGSILEELDNATSTTAAAHDVELLFFAATENPTLRCDKTAVVEALTQLVINAVTHSRDGQAVKISYQICPDSMLVFEVSDDGAGMSPNEVANVLTPMPTCDATPGIATADFGLGLPIAKAIADAHGGSLEVRSMSGQGTTTILTIPPERVILIEEDAA